MAEQILDKARDVVEGTIDFDGQRRAEGYATILLALTGLIAFNIGYALQDIRLCMYVGLSGTLLTFLVAVPSWPFYNTNPVKWLPVGSGLKARGG
ncbi:Signal peptidase complex subunit 1 [Cladobotryum mycophilum]|uniref:Signal peptidase complex subunit 1 n=1 Tax=Cladobotryum mycophilum TaxID=491253 RepID=A0ABR0SYY9_9HYPO